MEDTGMLEYNAALAVRNRYPEELSEAQQAEILAELPLRPSRADMVGLALVHHVNRKSNHSEDSLYWAYQVLLLGVAAEDNVGIYEKEPFDGLARMQCALLSAEIQQAMNTCSLDRVEARRVISNMINAWREKTPTELWNKQKNWFSTLIEIKNSTASKLAEHPRIKELTDYEIEIFTQALNTQ